MMEKSLNLSEKDKEFLIKFLSEKEAECDKIAAHCKDSEDLLHNVSGQSLAYWAVRQFIEVNS